MKRFVAIAGNIGVGKSTLVEMLCARLGWDPFVEGVVDNPYLADFYRDMPAWAFHSQIFFLSRRLRDLQDLGTRTNTVVQDRSVYEDAEIFARNLYEQGFINPRDWKTYGELYDALMHLLPAPNLVVYLQASVPTLLRRIEVRGRPYEKTISADYLQRLNTLYEDWIADFHRAPVLTVSADQVDFVASSHDFEAIAQQIQDRLLQPLDTRT